MKNLKIFTAISFLRNFYVYLPVLTPFLLANEITLSAVVFSTTFYSLASFLSEVPTGVFADAFGQKKSMIVGYILEAVGLLSVFLFPTTAGLYIASTVQGIGGACISGSEEALLYESVKRVDQNQYQKIYSQFLSNGQISFMCATTVAGFAYAAGGQKIFGPLMIITCALIFIAAVAASFLTDYKTKILNPEQGQQLFSTVKKSFSLIKKNSTIFTLTIVTALTLAGEYFLFGIYQPYFEANDVPVVWIGLVLTGGTLLNIIATRYTYLLEKYFSVEHILLFLNCALGAAYLCIALIVHPIFLIGVYIFMNGIMNLQTPIISDYINAHTPSSIRATVLSGVSFIRRFAQMFVMVLLGVIVGAWGIQIALIMQGVYLIIGILIGYFLLIRCGCVYKINA